MLLGGKQAGIKQVAIVTRNADFNRLMASILAEWKFFTVEDPASATVVFAERGLDLPEEFGDVVWLTPMPLAEGTFLTTPISLTGLYHLLEKEFFPSPRRHVRIAIEAAVDIQLDNAWHDGQLISLSDRGGRIVCPREIPRGTTLLLQTRLGGQFLQVPAEVLYCIPAGDAPGRACPQVGVLFKPAETKVIDQLRGYIEKVSVESACARENIPLNHPCLSWLDVPGDPWAL